MGKDYHWISQRLKRDHTVIMREAKRNKGDYSPYTASTAQRISGQRKSRTNKRKLEKHVNRDLREYVATRLKDDWSPDQIAGRLKREPPVNLNLTISHESIYDYIYNGEGRYEYLYPHLRTGRPRRRKKLNRKKRAKITIKNRVSIWERPTVIDQQKRFGDWETDSLQFTKQKSALSVQLERKSILCRLHRVANRQAENTEQAIWDSIESLPPEMWRSLTRDNGLENANHEQTKKVFNIQSFFCSAYASWQKGGVENINKLIRQYLPRKTDISKLTDEDVYQIQERLNNRPRKNLII